MFTYGYGEVKRLPLLELRNVIKKYRVGKEIVTALDGVNLSLEAGEFVAILGTSGSGKTTLLNVAAGLEKPTRGEVVFRNVTLNKLKEWQKVIFRRKQMGFIFQSYNLIPSLTAEENVALPLLFDNVPPWERMRRAAAVLAQMGLKDRRKHKPTEMSGGQQQRVAIARAIVHQPRIIFADELTGNLDSRTTHDIMLSLQATVKKQGQTLLMVTHDRDVANYADRIIFMVDGKIVSEEQGRK
ncbi:MAG: ABC transporter ATP-binding protein [Firmicutes bacterium]|nr:ABC transporter ATP-binding protein [Bacillota bacterium]